MAISLTRAPFCLASRQARASTVCFEGSPWIGTRIFRNRCISGSLHNNGQFLNSTRSTKPIVCRTSCLRCSIIPQFVLN